MRIVGYCICGSKRYVVFKEGGKYPGKLKITDGFHDKLADEKDIGKNRDYQWIDRKDVCLEKIISRMRGTRPWHPLLDPLRKEIRVWA